MSSNRVFTATICSFEPRMVTAPYFSHLIYNFLGLCKDKVTKATDSNDAHLA